MTVTVVVGGFYGDEGKGKMISYLATADDSDIVVRGGAGPNAGHTVRSGDDTYKVRMLPSGFLNKKSKVMIGPGVVVNPDILLQEIKEFGVEGRAYIDSQCGIIESSHVQDESSGYLQTKIGSTGSGTGAANSQRALRTLKMAHEIGHLKDIITDVPGQIHDTISDGGDVLVEGTQGTFLSLWHGGYPYVTSKDVTASGICADVGIGPTAVDNVIMVIKAFVTRVGSGPLNGELSPDEANRRGWAEKGTVTGRARRAAEFDYERGRRSVLLNGATQLALSKMDILYPECAGVRSYDGLSRNAKMFVNTIEERLKVPVSIIGTGPRDVDVIDCRDIKL